MANPWKILTYLTASSDALFQSNVTINGNTNLGNASSDIVSITAQVTASAGIEGRLYGTASYALDSDKLDGYHANAFAILAGNNTFTGPITASAGIEGRLYGTSSYALDADKLDGYDSSAFARLAADNTFTGQLTASNGLYVNGGLKVDGDLTYVNTTNLTVTDRKITIANGASNVDGEGPAGVYVGSDSTSLASIYASGATAGWHVSGAAGLFIAATSSADMTNIGSGIVAGGEFNVEAALRAINSTLGTATTISTVRTEYDKLRFIQTGSLSTGNAVVSLAKNAFVNANKDFVVVDVMVRDSNSNPWTNDLVSVYMANGATYVDVTIDAPGIAGGSWEYKLVAVNENTGSLGLIA